MRIVVPRDRDANRYLAHGGLVPGLVTHVLRPYLPVLPGDPGLRPPGVTVPVLLLRSLFAGRVALLLLGQGPEEALLVRRQLALLAIPAHPEVLDVLLRRPELHKLEPTLVHGHAPEELAPVPDDAPAVEPGIDLGEVRLLVVPTPMLLTREPVHETELKGVLLPLADPTREPLPTTDTLPSKRVPLQPPPHRADHELLLLDLAIEGLLGEHLGQGLEVLIEEVVEGGILLRQHLPQIVRIENRLRLVDAERVRVRILLIVEELLDLLRLLTDAEYPPGSTSSTRKRGLRAVRTGQRTLASVVPRPHLRTRGQRRLEPGHSISFPLLKGRIQLYGYVIRKREIPFLLYTFHIPQK